MKYRKYECVICGYIYDEELGDPEDGLAPGTRWEDIPDDWVMEEGTNPPDFFWNEDKQQVQRVVLEPEGWEQQRQTAFENLTIEQQLGNLYDDIEAGVFGDIAGKSKFYTAIKGIKDSIPKTE